MEKERIEEGIITSRRKVIHVGSSKAVTLPKLWLQFQRWLGREVSEVALVANDAIVIVPPDKEEKAKRILRELEREDR